MTDPQYFVLSFRSTKYFVGGVAPGVIASVYDGLEFKPHLGGHGDKAHYNRGVLYGTKALTSNRMLPHCGYEGLSTLGLKQ